MLCDNCGKREANVRYSENINGKTEACGIGKGLKTKINATPVFKKLPLSMLHFQKPSDNYTIYNSVFSSLKHKYIYSKVNITAFYHYSDILLMSIRKCCFFR